jgi:hypothetical protein
MAVREAEGETITPDARETFSKWGGQVHSPLTASWVEGRVERRNRERLARTDGRLGYSVADYARAYDARMPEVSKLLIILHVPFMALALLGTFRRRGVYFAEHFVVSLHLFAFYILFLELVSGGMTLLHLVLPSGGWFQECGEARLSLLWGSLVGTLSWRCGGPIPCHRGERWRGALGVIILLMAGHLIVYRTVQFLVIFILT